MITPPSDLQTQRRQGVRAAALERRIRARDPLGVIDGFGGGEQTPPACWQGQEGGFSRGTCPLT